MFQVSQTKDYDSLVFTIKKPKHQKLANYSKEEIIKHTSNPVSRLTNKPDTTYSIRCHQNPCIVKGTCVQYDCHLDFINIYIAKDVFAGKHVFINSIEFVQKAENFGTCMPLLANNSHYLIQSLYSSCNNRKLVRRF
jgi:hypothetical protein